MVFWMVGIEFVLIRCILSEKEKLGCLDRM